MRGIDLSAKTLTELHTANTLITKMLYSASPENRDDLLKLRTLINSAKDSADALTHHYLACNAESFKSQLAEIVNNKAA